ncbi:hypothetical protein [Succinimonas sp.]|uniref:hypothetical protein n=1 Tax=Succinimonas sp. TaxID=1936151 RepID=UPI00386FBE3C
MKIGYASGLTAGLVMMAAMGFNYAGAADFFYDMHIEASDVYRMVGEIQEGDSLKFNKILARTRHSGRQGYLFLNSGGGRLDEASKIMDIVTMNKLATVVPDEFLCASACFNIFISGAQRYAYPDSQIGVHRVSVLHSVENQYTKGDSLELNELFKKYNVPDNIRLAMIDTPANELHYLSKEDKAKLSSPGKPKVVVVYKNTPASQGTPQQASNNSSSPARAENDVPRPAEYPEYRSQRQFKSLAEFVRAFSDLKKSKNSDEFKLNEMEKTFRSEIIRLTDKELDDYQRMYLKKATFQFEKQLEYTRKILAAARIQDKSVYSDVLLNLCNNQINEILLLNNMISSVAFTDDAKDMLFREKGVFQEMVLEEKFNNTVSLCRAGYCDEDLVRTQQRTWNAGREEFLKINKTNTDNLQGYMIHSQLVYLRDLSLVLLGDVSRKPYFNRFEFASVPSLLNSLQEIQSDVTRGKLTSSDIINFNAVLGGFLEAVLAHQMKMKGYDENDIHNMEYSGDAAHAAFVKFMNESLKANGARPTPGVADLDANIVRITNLLSLLLENDDIKRVIPFSYVCEHQLCSNTERADVVNKYNDRISNLQKLCNARKCNSDLLNKYNNMFALYLKSYTALADKVGDNKLREHLMTAFYAQALYLLNNNVKALE